MNLITQPQHKAAQIDQINHETLLYVQAQLKRSYDLVFNDGDPQPVLDALGANATAALASYSAFFQALNTIGITDNIVTPNTSVFQPQGNGTVIYVPATEVPAIEG